MAIDKSAILESAQLYTSKGQFDKAAAEWKKLTTGAPADATIYNTIGDLHLKRNAPTDAIEAFFQAAAAFRAADAALKAIALYKKILKVDPTRADAYRCMGDLNAERGLAGNAVADYLILAKMLLKSGKQDEATDVYRKIAGLDPNNAEALQRLGAVSPGQASTSSAEKADAGAGRAAEPDMPAGPYKLPADYSRQSFLSDAIKLTAAGQFAEADMVLMEMLSREPGDPEVCRLMATLHLKQGQLACAKSEFQFLAEAAMRAHDYVLAESMLLEYLKADPACVQLCELLGRLYEQNGDVPAAVARYGKALEALVASPDPDLPTLPAELYEKLLGLAPSSPLIGQYAALFPSAVAAQPLTAEAQAVEAPAQPQTPVAEPDEQPAAPATGKLAFKFAGSPPDAARAEEAEAKEEGKPAPAKMVFRFAGKAEPSPPPQEPVEAQAESIQEPAGWGRTAEAAPVAAAPDYEEQYQLGAAYQQMGLPELAEESLLIAIQDQDHFADSCRLLALCCSERGQVQEAINYLERGLASPKPLGGEAAALLRYELGLLYEAGGRVEQALQVFSAVPTFRDVHEHIARLHDGQTGESASQAAVQEPVAVGHQAGAGDASGVAKKKRRISYL